MGDRIRALRSGFARKRGEDLDVAVVLPSSPRTLRSALPLTGGSRQHDCLVVVIAGGLGSALRTEAIQRLSSSGFISVDVAAAEGSLTEGDLRTARARLWRPRVVRKNGPALTGAGEGPGAAAADFRCPGLIDPVEITYRRSGSSRCAHTSRAMRRTRA